MTTQLELIENAAEMFVHSNSTEQSGISAMYKRSPIDSRFGYKLFQYDLERDKSYALQHHASQFGLAPKVYSKFKIHQYDVFGFGIQTDVCGFVTEALDETLRQYMYRVFGGFNHNYYDEIRFRIADEAQAINITFDDNNSGNIAKHLNSDKWQIIDFGNESFYDYKLNTLHFVGPIIEN